MTNEEYVARIQAGERDKLLELWEQVERFVALQARRRYYLSDGMGGVDIEDLYQSGYIALVAAADTYDPTTGRQFIGWFSLHLKTAFAEAGGYRSKKQSLDPLHRAGSIDAPASEDGDTTIAELIVDPGAEQDILDAEEKVYAAQLHAALDRAMKTLTADEEASIRARYYQENTLEQMGPRGKNLVFAALRKLRRPKIVQELRRSV